MKKTKLISFALLCVFFSFLLTQYPGGHTQWEAEHDHHAVISSDSIDGFLLKEDFKKFIFKLNFNIEALLFYTLSLSLFCSLLIRSAQRAVFFTPIFYQSNYVVSSPSFS